MYCPGTAQIQGLFWWVVPEAVNIHVLYNIQILHWKQRIDLKKRKLGQSRGQLIRTLLIASWIMQKIIVSYKILYA